MGTGLILVLLSFLYISNADTFAWDETVTINVPKANYTSTFNYTTTGYASSFSIIQQPVLGTLSILNSAQGTFAYYPSVAGVDVIVWSVTVDDNPTLMATLNIRVVRVAQPPVAIFQQPIVGSLLSVTGNLNISSPNQVPAIKAVFSSPLATVRGTLTINPAVPILTATIPDPLACNNTPCVFSTKQDSIRQQSIYLKQDLNAIGITRAGNQITGLSIHISQQPEYDFTNFRVGLTHTTTTALASFINTTIVFFEPTLSASSLTQDNWLSVQFSQPFYYDGSSNLLIELSTQALSDSPNGVNGGVYVKPTGQTSRSVTAGNAFNNRPYPFDVDGSLVFSSSVMDLSFDFLSDVVRFAYTANDISPAADLLDTFFYTVDDGLYVSANAQISLEIIYCAPTFFGPACTACGCTPASSTSCSDGFGGNGTCNCIGGYIGPQCELLADFNVGASLSGLSSSVAFSPSFTPSGHRYTIVLPPNPSPFTILPIHSADLSASTFVNGQALFPTSVLPYTSSPTSAQDGSSSQITVVSALPRYRPYGYNDVTYTFYVIQLTDPADANPNQQHTPARVLDLTFGRTHWDVSDYGPFLVDLARVAGVDRRQLFVYTEIDNPAPGSTIITTTTLRVAFIPLMVANSSTALSYAGAASSVATLAAGAGTMTSQFHDLVQIYLFQPTSTILQQDKEDILVYSCGDGTFAMSTCSSDNTDTSFGANLLGRYVGVFIIIVISAIFVFLCLVYYLLKVFVFPSDGQEESPKETDVELEGRDNPQDEGDGTPTFVVLPTGDPSPPEGSPTSRRSEAAPPVPARPESRRSMAAPSPDVSSSNAADGAIVISGGAGRTPPRVKDAPISSNYDKLDDDVNGVDL